MPPLPCWPVLEFVVLSFGEGDKIEDCISSMYSLQPLSNTVNVAILEPTDAEIMHLSQRLFRYSVSLSLSQQVHRYLFLFTYKDNLLKVGIMYLSLRL